MKVGKDVKPIIKFNGGNPVALCNRCRIIMCYVSGIKNEGKQEKWVVRESLVSKELDITSRPIGKEAPTHCDNCLNLLNITLNE